LADVHDPKTRSRNMAAIRGKDTKPELIIRGGLHAEGYRFRLHDKRLPGKPDLVLRKYNAAVFVNCCFWHGHNCRMFKWPKTREAFWRDKIGGNLKRDLCNQNMLLSDGWRVGVIWECALKGRERLPQDEVIDRITRWLSSGAEEFCIRGNGGD